jgi:adenylate kinase family enzyme
MKKIYIIGISGSGKTYLSEKISEKLNIKKIDLDDIYFLEKYNKKRGLKECEDILAKKIKNLDN